MNTFKDIRKLTIDQVQSWLAERMPKPDSLQAGRLACYYFQRAQSRDLQDSPQENGYGSILCLWQFIQQRQPGEIKVRAYNPEPEEHYWHSTHSVIEVLVEDHPFLVASILMELDRQDILVHNLNHPVIPCHRTPQGQLQSLAEPASDEDSGQHEALIRMEIDRQADQSALEPVVTGIKKVVQDVLQVVSDWSAITARLDEAISWCCSQPQPVNPKELEESLAFLHWLKQDNFLFIGYRYYEVHGQDQAMQLRIRKDSGLGTFREAYRRSPARQSLSPYLQARLQEPELLVITKSPSRSTIQRPAHLDYLGIKQFAPTGEVVGEWRFFGLFSSQVYSAPLDQIPLIRKKVATLLAVADTPAASHRGRALRHIISNYPRDEILQSSQEQLQDTVMGLLECQERRQLRVFLRPDSYDRFVTAMVYVPRDRFNTELRQRFQQILLDELDGHSIDFRVHLSEHPLVQLQFIVHCQHSHEQSLAVDSLEQTMASAMLSWQDQLRQAILEKHGEATGSRLYRCYAQAFPAAYREDIPPRQAVADIERFQQLDSPQPINAFLYHPVSDLDRWHFRVLGRGEQLALSDVLPILEQMGVKVFSAHPYGIHPRGSEPGWVLDFSMVPCSRLNLQDSALRDEFQQTFVRTWKGELENDGFNALVVSCGLKWRQVVVLRALAKYLLQLQVPFSQAYMEATLNGNPAITRQLIELFEARFAHGSAEQRKTAMATIRAQLNPQLDAVASLDEDRILRHFLSVIEAMQRTNACQRDGQGNPRAYLSFKLKPEDIPAAPQPRPLFEIFVYAPWVEGVHMRGGKIARGGLRWSDRREDFRTEILGLMKAQMVKNAIIVPHGAKGGFIPKRLPAQGSRDELLAEAIHSYRTFICGLLDLTDNLQQGQVIPPDDVVRYDDDDPYLVVAADKGTASFSDTANALSHSYGFWLGDAFASGGSQGYDHKKMGITARGAWESVKRLFRERGMDCQSQAFTVIGIGDMAGDVFGNGMGLSRHIRLVAAFNHRHIFIDPNPDTRSSFQERQRLASLPRSSWDDYDPGLISEGGGVFSRQAKTICLSPQACQRLAISQTRLTPAELIQHILRAPADLLWNGGIGTYVKASTESNPQVGDPSNDPVRIDARELRIRVVAEGGNLGLTQQARIEFARLGGLINTDAVDNAGGVNSSDHEVNIKILLDQIVAAGDLTLKQRNRILADMTDEIASLVLRHNALHSQRLSLSNHMSGELFNDHRDLIRLYEKEGRLRRRLEGLPEDAELKARSRAGQGLYRPEIAVLLAHARLKLSEALVEARVDEDPYLCDYLYHYFPTPLRTRFARQIRQHPLKTEILATHLSNLVSNRMGACFLEYLQQETRCSALDAVRAFIALVEIESLQPLWDRFDAIDAAVDNRVIQDEQAKIQRHVEKACIWLIRTHGSALAIQPLIDTYQAGVQAIDRQLDALLGQSEGEWLQTTTAQQVEAGLPQGLARDCAALRYHYYGLSIVAIAGRAEQSVSALLCSGRTPVAALAAWSDPGAAGQ